MKLNKLLKLILVAVLLSIGCESYAQVTIGTDKEPEKFSVLEIISNEQRGLRMPHLTTKQRNDMTDSPDFQALKTTLAKGLTIYNTTSDCLEFWNGTKWVSTCEDVCTPMTGTGTITPSSVTVNVGNSQLFTVSGFSNVTRYEWYVDNSLESTTTSPNFTYSVPSGAVSGLTIPVYVIAYDNCNNSKRLDATITTCRPLAGTGSVTPANVTLNVGESQVFSVTGFTNVTSYQWYLNGSPVSGQTSSSYSYTATSGTGASIYVIAYGCNGSSAQSNTASVTICTPVGTGSITPTNVTLNVGQSQVFTANGFSNATSYQWYLNGSPVSGQTSSSYSYTATSGTSASIYVIAYGCNGSSEQSNTASVTITPACTTPTVNVTQGNRCGTGTVSLSASTTNGTIYWYTTSSGGTSIATGTSYVTPSITSTTTYYVEAVDGTCKSARVAVTATINALPTVTGTTSNSRCGAGTITLSATASTGATIRWYSASTGGTLLTTGLSYTPSISNTTTYYVEAYNSNTGCVSASRTAVTATVNALPTVTGTTSNSRCGTGTVTLSATASTGATIRWYSASTGGTLLTTGLNYTPSISNTTTYYVEAYNSNTGCVSASRTAVTATINALPTVTGTTSNSRCGAGTVTLSATASTGATIRWYSASTGGTLLTTGLNYTTPSISSTTTYYAEAYNSTTGCVSSTRTAVTATVNALPATPTASTPLTVSPSTTFVLTATAPTGCTVDWYNASTGGTLLATGSTYTVSGGRTTGTYYYYAAARNTTTGCVSANRVMVTVNVTAPTCDLGSASITRSGASDPIRPLTITNSTNGGYYNGATFYINNLPAGASVSWKVVETVSGTQVGGPTSGSYFTWKPSSAPNTVTAIRVIATITCSNGMTSELSVNASYRSYCSVGGARSEPDPYGIGYNAGSGILWCTRSGTGWSESGSGCTVGWMYDESQKGCTKVW